MWDWETCTIWPDGGGFVTCAAGAKLSAVDQFRQEKEMKEKELAELEEKLVEVQQQHADYVYETDKKRLIEMHKYSVYTCCLENNRTSLHTSCGLSCYFTPNHNCSYSKLFLFPS